MKSIQKTLYTVYIQYKWFKCAINGKKCNNYEIYKGQKYHRDGNTRYVSRFWNHFKGANIKILFRLISNFAGQNKKS